MSLKLKNCPYCHRKAEWFYPPRENAWYEVLCSSGKGIIESGPTLEEAIKAWNKRKKS